MLIGRRYQAQRQSALSFLDPGSIKEGGEAEDTMLLRFVLTRNATKALHRYLRI